MMSSDLQGTDISATFSPIYWGSAISLLLGGITILQAFLYFVRAKDRPIVKFMAAAMLILDLTDTALVTYSVYYYLIPRFGSLARLTTMTPELTAECLIATTVTCISQLYFVYQLIGAKRNGKGSWAIIWIIAILCILSFAGGIACTVMMQIFRHSIFARRNIEFSISFGIAKGFGTATDIGATIAMCMFLNSVKTGISQSNALVNNLILYVFNRGALVTLAQAVLFITFYAAPSSSAWFAVHLIIPKLYTNTFFAMLNARDHLKEKHMTGTMRYTGTQETHEQRGKFRSGYGQEERTALTSQEDIRVQDDRLPRATGISSSGTVFVEDFTVAHH